MTVETLTVTVTPEQALAIAHADAARVYRDADKFRIIVSQEVDGWHVDYELKQLVCGGGPHYIIDAETGAITWKRYDQ